MNPIAPTVETARAGGGAARERILAAAAEVFARQGLMAATTREIALAAKVNEVTIFRQFQSKQNLLAAVIKRVFAREPEAETAARKKPPGSLHEIVAQYAQSYHARLSRNVRLIRVLIGEIQHCDEQAREVVRGVFHPQRQEFIERLRAAQAQGWLRAGADPGMIADQLGGMIFTSLLKRDMPMPHSYSAARYLESCVETMTRGYAEPAPRRGQGGGR